MYQALGRGVVKKAGGAFEVKVEILDDRTGQRVRFQSYTVSSMTELRQAVQTDLKALAASEQDAALNAAVVDVLLGSI